MIRGSDGLDYEDLAARLLGEPAKTGRNDILSSTHSAAFKAAYSEAWDRRKAEGCPPLECCRSAYAQACISVIGLDGDDACTAAGSTVTLDTHAYL